MRFGIISDIHGNLVALQAVLGFLGEVDQIWCLGDVVGYGPEPNECVQTLMDLDHVIVMGNHDAAALGVIPARDFNEEARRAIEWTGRQLSRESSAFLRAAPQRLEHGEILLVHGTPRDPIWEYLTTPEQASELFALGGPPYTFLGHTHVPLIFALSPDGRLEGARPEDGNELDLGPERVLVNPGSVGQPRDGDPRAACAVVDSARSHVEFHRVPYDVAETQRRMHAVGLSSWLAERLAHGR